MMGCCLHLLLVCILVCGNDVLVFIVVPVPRPILSFMTMTIPFVSLLALSCIQPAAPSVAQRTSVFCYHPNKSLTLEVYSIAASTIHTPGYSELRGRFVERNLTKKSPKKSTLKIMWALVHCDVRADNKNFNFNFHMTVVPRHTTACPSLSLDWPACLMLWILSIAYPCYRLHRAIDQHLLRVSQGVTSGWIRITHVDDATKTVACS